MNKLIGLKNIKYEIKHLKEPLCHIIFYGPRGSGKTALSEYIAESRNKKLIFLTGNTLKLNELMNVFVNVEEGDVILIDEIHRLTPRVEELLYQPMEKFQVSIKNTAGTIQTYPLPKFTLIGTTTKPSMISKPLMSRFQVAFQIPHYSLRELARIVRLKQSVSRSSALKIALNIITPREAINLASRVMNLVKDTTEKEVSNSLEFIGYKYGLSKSERFYLKIVYNVGKIGLSNLSSALQLDEDEVRYIEEKLIRNGYIQISSRGRCLSVKGLIKIKEMKR